jgi:hypothetical protein
MIPYIATMSTIASRKRVAVRRRVIQPRHLVDDAHAQHLGLRGCPRGNQPAVGHLRHAKAMGIVVRPFASPAGEAASFRAGEGSDSPTAEKLPSSRARLD